MRSNTNRPRFEPQQVLSAGDFVLCIPVLVVERSRAEMGSKQGVGNSMVKDSKSPAQNRHRRQHDHDVRQLNLEEKFQ